MLSDKLVSQRNIFLGNRLLLGRHPVDYNSALSYYFCFQTFPFCYFSGTRIPPTRRQCRRYCGQYPRTHTSRWSPKHGRVECCDTCRRATGFNAIVEGCASESSYAGPESRERRLLWWSRQYVIVAIIPASRIPLTESCSSVWLDNTVYDQSVRIPALGTPLCDALVMLDLYWNQVHIPK